ncbi:MAG: pyridoxamine 5'-phosphate oxidase family protein [Promethearchaeota archaeon]
MKIDYNELKEEIEDFFEKNKTLVLATSANDKVSARMIEFVNIGLTLMFETDKRSGKFKQIMKNPNVAVCAKNVQIEGIASVGEHPMDGSNMPFIELYKKHHQYAFQLYSHLENSIVIKIKPTLVTLWKNVDGQPFQDFLFVNEQKAERVCYDISK